MDNKETCQRIDRICLAVGTDSAERLNALHACRPGHPWNRDNDWCWRNAWALVAQQRLSSVSSEEYGLVARQSRC